MTWSFSHFRAHILACASLLTLVGCGTTNESQPTLVLSEVTANLESPDINVRIRSAHALGNLGPHARAAVPDLILAATDRDSELQAAVASALGRIGDATPEATATLRALSANDVAFVREAASRALLRLGAPHDTPVVAHR